MAKQVNAIKKMPEQKQTVYAIKEIPEQPVITSQFILSKEKCSLCKHINAFICEHNTPVRDSLRVITEPSSKKIHLEYVKRKLSENQDENEFDSNNLSKALALNRTKTDHPLNKSYEGNNTANNAYNNQIRKADEKDEKKTVVKPVKKKWCCVCCCC